MSSHRILRSIATALAALWLAALPAAAQEFPAKPVKVVVAFAAGGFADSVARLISERLSERLRQTFVVENRPGAGGNIAAKYVASSDPDGYTQLATTTALAISDAVDKKKGFTAADFRAIAIVATTPEILAVSTASSAKSLKDLVAVAQSKSISFGSAGVGTGSHIAAEYFFKSLAKVQAVHVPFQGGAPAINAVIGNHVEVLAASLAGGLVEQINSGRLRGLAVAREQRLQQLPEVPTFAESGFAGFNAASWVGFFAPAQTDLKLLARLNEAINQVVKEPPVLDRLRRLGAEPTGLTQPEADAFFRAEVEKWGKMVGGIGLATN